MQAQKPAGIAPSRLLAGLFAPDVIAVETRQAIGADVLYPEEARYVARAAPKRIAEFAAGRACARAALAQLGISDFVLHVGADREPIWPSQVAGSITHTNGFCGVVVARTASIAALGVDAEVRHAVHRELWPGICTPTELLSLESLAQDDALDRATAIFCLKEAFFKCQYALTQEWLNFSDLSLEFESAVEAQLSPRRALRLEAWQAAPWQGRIAHEPGLTAAGVSVAAVGCQRI